ncbi:hypothetical protein [Sphingomonas immobilis]|uniref:Uncharacterized protein n=1 Tax=Sphingomonas immobilis TaxID=3063997 RepID=A0ABT8ZYR2_9SPHN|nr:hypothetical protein [Sphingomonas sp. CA1-15]MDO7842342.1 hypothetical protein [Sphingomonas sp. CA1-15]
MPTRPLTRAQILENRAFLAALRRTGNVRAAAREVGAHRAKFTKRRAAHPNFAIEWDAALVVADAALKSAAQSAPQPAPAGDPHPDEHRIIRTRSGRVQIRRGKPGRLDARAEQAFLSALSATANIRLSAAAAGFSHSAFYARARSNPGFEREMRLALKKGAERLEAALLESFTPFAYADDAWRHNDPPAIPPMTVDQALALLQLHDKRIRDADEPAAIKRRRGESNDAWSYRMDAMFKQGLARQREAADIAEAERQAGGEEPQWDVPIELIDLALVRLRKSARARD